MKISKLLTSALAISLFTAPAFAIQGSKFSATLSKTALLDETTNHTATVLETTIHTASKKELLIGVSLEAGLYTQTQVKGKNGSYDSANAMAGVDITVYVDGIPAEPGTITFNQREQELNAVLGGVIESCTFSTDNDGDGVVDDDITINIEDDCVVTDEEIELIQRTMSAHHFNFVMPNLSSGDHVVTVEASINTSSSAGAGSASATALVGKGSLTVEGVRAINQDGGVVILD
ncbi:hypothetical protein QP938_09565 [Porticoccaceae bacterium LTM1]|nr:hypothetical protein QP938_09565 [Porticoccaceae bacterium LTM1]